MGKTIKILDLNFDNYNLGKITIKNDIVVNISGITITSKPTTIENSIQLGITYNPSNTIQLGVRWSSSDTSVATVNSSGLVTVLKAGATTITATSISNPSLSDSFVTTCSLSATPIPVTLISITNKVTSLSVGDTRQLIVSISPSNASNTGISFSSSDTSVATVNSSGLVTVLKAGSVIITATSLYSSSITDNFTLTIQEASVGVTSIGIAGNTTGVVGNSLQLTTNILPSNATLKTVTWSSSNTSVATVNSSGLVTFIASGNAIITATSTSNPAINGTLSITVSEAASGVTAMYNNYITLSGRANTPQLLNMLNDLKTAGLLSKLSGLWYMAGTSFNQVKLNIANLNGLSLKNPNDAFVFNYSTNGTKATNFNAWLDTQIKPSLNNTFFGILGSGYVDKLCISGISCVGDATITGMPLQLCPYGYFGKILYTPVNNSKAITADSSSMVSEGALVLSLSPSTYIYKNSLSSWTGSYGIGNSTANTNFGFLNVPNTNNTSGSVANTTTIVKLIMLGNTALTDAEVTSLYNIINTYSALL